MKNVIYQYYKKDIDDHIILVQINPHTLEGMELIISPENTITKTIRSFDQKIYDDLSYDDFTRCSPLVFNIYLKGLYK